MPESRREKSQKCTRYPLGTVSAILTRSFADRLVVVALIAVLKTTAEVGTGVICVEPDRLGVIADGFVAVARIAVR
jgi:hypothetical protein